MNRSLIARALLGTVVLVAVSAALAALGASPASAAGTNVWTQCSPNVPCTITNAVIYDSPRTTQMVKAATATGTLSPSGGTLAVSGLTGRMGNRVFLGGQGTVSVDASGTITGFNWSADLMDGNDIPMAGTLAPDGDLVSATLGPVSLTMIGGQPITIDGTLTPPGAGGTWTFAAASAENVNGYPWFAFEEHYDEVGGVVTDLDRTVTVTVNTTLGPLTLTDCDLSIIEDSGVGSAVLHPCQLSWSGGAFTAEASGVLSQDAAGALLADLSVSSDLAGLLLDFDASLFGDLSAPNPVLAIDGHLTSTGGWTTAGGAVDFAAGTDIAIDIDMAAGQVDISLAGDVTVTLASADGTDEVYVTGYADTSIDGTDVQIDFGADAYLTLTGATSGTASANVTGSMTIDLATEQAVLDVVTTGTGDLDIEGTDLQFTGAVTLHADISWSSGLEVTATLDGEVDLAIGSFLVVHGTGSAVLQDNAIAITLAADATLTFNGHVVALQAGATIEVDLPTGFITFDVTAAATGTVTVDPVGQVELDGVLHLSGSYDVDDGLPSLVATLDQLDLSATWAGGQLDAAVTGAISGGQLELSLVGSGDLTLGGASVTGGVTGVVGIDLSTGLATVDLTAGASATLAIANGVTLSGALHVGGTIDLAASPIAVDLTIDGISILLEFQGGHLEALGTATFDGTTLALTLTDTVLVFDAGPQLDFLDGGTLVADLATEQLALNLTVAAQTLTFGSGATLELAQQPIVATADLSTDPVALALTITGVSATFTWDGGSLTGTADLHLTGSFDQLDLTFASSATLTMGSTTATLAAGATASLDLDTLVLDLDVTASGSVTWPKGSITLQALHVWGTVELDTATPDLQVTATATISLGGLAGSITAGVTGTVDDDSIDLVLAAGGTMTFGASTIDLAAGGTIVITFADATATLDLDAAAGAVLDLDGAGHVELTGNLQITGTVTHTGGGVVANVTITGLSLDVLVVRNGNELVDLHVTAGFTVAWSSTTGKLTLVGPLSVNATGEVLGNPTTIAIQVTSLQVTLGPPLRIDLDLTTQASVDLGEATLVGGLRLNGWVRFGASPAWSITWDGLVELGGGPGTVTVDTYGTLTSTTLAGAVLQVTAISTNPNVTLNAAFGVSGTLRLFPFEVDVAGTGSLTVAGLASASGTFATTIEGSATTGWTITLTATAGGALGGSSFVLTDLEATVVKGVGTPWELDALTAHLVGVVRGISVEADVALVSVDPGTGALTFDILTGPGAFAPIIAFGVDPTKSQGAPATMDITSGTITIDPSPTTVTATLTLSGPLPIGAVDIDAGITLSLTYSGGVAQATLSGSLSFAGGAVLGTFTGTIDTTNGFLLTLTVNAANPGGAASFTGTVNLTYLTTSSGATLTVTGLFRYSWSLSGPLNTSVVVLITAPLSITGSIGTSGGTIVGGGTVSGGALFKLGPFGLPFGLANAPFTVTLAFDGQADGYSLDSATLAIPTSATVRVSAVLAGAFLDLRGATLVLDLDTGVMTASFNQVSFRAVVEALVARAGFGTNVSNFTVTVDGGGLHMAGQVEFVVYAGVNVVLVNAHAVVWGNVNLAYDAGNLYLQGSLAASSGVGILANVLSVKVDGVTTFAGNIAFDTGAFFFSGSAAIDARFQVAGLNIGHAWGDGTIYLTSNLGALLPGLSGPGMWITNSFVEGEVFGDGGYNVRFGAWNRNQEVVWDFGSNYGWCATKHVKAPWTLWDWKQKDTQKKGPLVANGSLNCDAFPNPPSGSATVAVVEGEAPLPGIVVELISTQGEWVFRPYYTYFDDETGQSESCGFYNEFNAPFPMCFEYVQVEVVLQSLTTGADGTVTFAGVGTGLRKVRVVLPGSGWSYVFDPDVVVNGQDTVYFSPVAFTYTFGITKPGTIGGTVFADLDGNGTKAGYEFDMAGVTVVLRRQSGTGTWVAVASQQTNAGGQYAFPNLQGGTYQVDVVPVVGWTVSTGNDPSTVTLTAGTPSASPVFGLKPPLAAVGGQVFRDTNGNGLWDGAEGPAGSRTVSLRVDLDANGSYETSFGSRTTDPAGWYAFTGVPVGFAYRLTVSTGWSWTVTTGNQPWHFFTGAATGSYGTTFGIKQSTPKEVVGVAVDAGLDGHAQLGDAPLPGVTVELVDAETASVLATTITDSTGRFALAGVEDGAYRVRIVAPNGSWSYAADPDSGCLPGGACPAADGSAPIELAESCAGRGACVEGDRVQVGVYGLVPPASCGSDPAGSECATGHPVTGTVALDGGDGATGKDDEGLPGIPVGLFDGNEALVETVVTDGSGGFRFDAVDGGPFTVRLLPTRTALQPLVDPDGVADGSVDVPVVEGPTSVGTILIRDWSQPLGSAELTGWVRQDTDGSGTVGELDEPVPGVEVTVRGGEGEVLALAVTDGTGRFSVRGLPAGTVAVEVAAPAGAVVLGDPDGGSDGAAAVTLEAKRSTSVGTFLVSARTIVRGDVKDDADGDGSVGAGDAGVKGVTVQLLDRVRGTQIASTVTDDAGQYELIAPSGGVYEVRISLPGGKGVVRDPSGGSATTTVVSTLAGRTTPLATFLIGDVLR